MKTFYKQISFLLLSFLCSLLVCQAQVTISPNNRLVDNTASLNEWEVANIKSILAEIEKDHNLQLAVVMEKTTGSESLEEYASRLLASWQGQPGSKGRGIILIAKDDRKVFVNGDEVLNAKLSSGDKKRIVEEIVVPEFRGGRFSLGIEQGIDAVEILATGGNLSETSTFQIKNYPLISILFVIVILSFLRGFIKSVRIKLGIVVVVAVVFYLVFASITHSVLILLLSIFPLLGRSTRGGGGEYGGGYSDGNTGGGGDNSESSFSLGGGSFGSGGASGDWSSLSHSHKKFEFSQEQKEAVEQAVKELELESSGEIVVYFARKSDSYFEGSWKLSSALGILAAVTVICLSFVWQFPASFSTMNIALSVISVMVSGLTIAYFFPTVRLAFVPLNIMDNRVVTRARDIFLQEEIFNTVERTGILIYISELEQRVQILGDKGINEVILQEDWDKILNMVTGAIKDGNPASGIVAAIHECKKLLLDNGFVVRVDDTNELSDEMIIEE